MPFRIKRYYGYGLITIIALALPFITIGGNHIFLLSFDKKQLQLLGTVFDMQELYMMPFLLMLLFIGIFAATTIGGRVFCGWGCPQTIFRVIYRDFIETKLLKLRKRISNKQKEPDYSDKKNIIKRLIALFLWSLLAMIAAADFIWYFVPPEDFFVYIMHSSEHGVVLGMFITITLFLIYDVIFLKENFCVYVCPYSRIQSVLYDTNTLQAIYNPNRGGEIYNQNKEKLVFKQKDLKEESNECTTCEKCVTVCPTHIDIRKGLQLECINCLECVDACTTVMGKLGKESLVQWSSNNAIATKEKTKIFRTTTYMYGVALLIIISMLFFMGSKKKYMILDITKGERLFKIRENSEVTNDYLMRFKNTEPNRHTYKLEVIGAYKDKIEIKRFTQVSIGAGQSAKDVLILSTHEKLKSGNHEVKIKAFSTSEPQRVMLLKRLTFIYPSEDKLQP